MPVSRRPVGGNLTCQAPVFDGSFFILIPRPDTAAPIGNASASGNKTRHGRQHFREAPMPRLALGNVKSEQCCDDRWLKNRTSVLDGGTTNKNRPEALSFWPVAVLERATGIEPASSAWKAGVLPLNYARKIWSGRQDSNLRHPAPKAGALPNCATSRRC